MQTWVLLHRQGTSGRCAWTVQRPRLHFCGKGSPSWKRGCSGSSSPKRMWSKRQAAERANAGVNGHVGMQEDRRTRSPHRGLPTTAWLLPLASRRLCLGLAGAWCQARVCLTTKSANPAQSHRNTQTPPPRQGRHARAQGSLGGFLSNPVVVWHPGCAIEGTALRPSPPLFTGTFLVYSSARSSSCTGRPGGRPSN